MCPYSLITQLIFFTFALLILYSIFKALSEGNVFSQMSFGLQGIVGENECLVDGVSFYYQYFPRRHHRRPSLKVRVASFSVGNFKIVKESPIDIFFKWMGMNQEIQTGDRDFDRTFYILSDQRGHAGSCLADPEIRDLIRALVALGFNEVGCSKKALYARWNNFHLGNQVDPELINKSGRALSALSKKVSTYGDIPEPGLPMWKFKKAISFLIPILLNGAAIFFSIHFLRFTPVNPGQVMSDSLWISVPALILFIFLSAWFLRGRSSSHREWLLVLAFSLTGFIFSTYYARVWYNGAMDPSSEVEEKTLLITKKWETRRKSSIGYRVGVESWKPGRQIESFRVSFEEYSGVVPGKSRLQCQIHPGRLGYEWIEKTSIRN